MNMSNQIFPPKKSRYSAEIDWGAWHLSDVILTCCYQREENIEMLEYPGYWNNASALTFFLLR